MARPTARDLYEPTALIGVISSLIRPKTFFLNRWFGRVLKFDTQNVFLDLEIKRRRVAAFCAPYGKGRVVREMGYQSRELSPSYINEVKFMRPLRSMQRAIGETIGGDGGRPLSNLQRHMMRVSAESLEMVEAVVRRKELMAVQGLVEGKLTIEAQGVPTSEVDLMRDPALNIQLTLGARWNQAGANPLRDLNKWNELAHKIEGVRIEAVVMDPDAIEAAMDNADFLAKLDNRNAIVAPGGGFLIGPVSYADGPVYHGMLGTIEVWSYSDFYEDPLTGELKPFLPSGTVLGMSAAIDGAQLHGAILDEEAGIQSHEFFPNSWLERNPSGRMLQIQSAPLVAPLRPNGSYSARVL